MGNETIASLSLPTIFGILVALAAVRLSLRGKRALFFRLLTELSAVGMKVLALIFLLVRPFVVQTYTVSSRSMEPGLQRGESIVVSKWVYRWHAPAYGELVVFQSPEPGKGELIKRVIGLPGDTLEGTAGAVLLQTRGSKPRRIDHATLRNLLRVDDDASVALTTEAVWCDGKRLTPEALAKRIGKPEAFVAIEPGQLLRNGQPLTESYVAEDIAAPFGPVTVPTGHLFVLGDNRNRSHDARFWGPLPESRVIGRAECIFWPLNHAKRISN
ncbi:MAG: signal peptidase I [Armatimonas sp.]